MGLNDTDVLESTLTRLYGNWKMDSTVSVNYWNRLGLDVSGGLMEPALTRLCWNWKLLDYTVRESYWTRLKLDVAMLDWKAETGS